MEDLRKYTRKSEIYKLSAEEQMEKMKLVMKEVEKISAYTGVSEEAAYNLFLNGYDKYPYGKPQTDEVARGSGNREYGCRRLREKLPNFSGVSFFRAGNSSNRVNAFHICVYVHRCAVPRYIALQHP